MFYLLLLSGAAFVAAGAVLAAQARVIDAGLPLPRAALALLAAFAAARGASDWAELARADEGSPGGAIASLHVVLLAASFVLLLGFGVTVLGPARRRASFAPAVAASALAAWSVALASLLRAGAGAPAAGPTAMVEVLTRCLLGLPASACAAMGLLTLARAVELESWMGSRFVRGAGIAFVVHGIADALGGVTGGLHAGGPLGASGIGAAVGLPVALLETGSAAAIAILLSEAFVFQTSQRLRREETHLRDDLMKLVAHELGTPVVALELAADRLERARVGARPIDPRLVADVEACARTLRRVVADLHVTSGIQARELEILPSPIDLRPVLARAAEVASMHGGDRPPVAVTCPDELPPVLADPARVDQILGNLLTNASKYSVRGSPVAVAADADGAAVTVRVVNEGPSIPPAEADRIFSRHYRAEPARTTARGLGLGLYVARALVEAHGGRIWVESGDGRTAFCFTLPSPSPVRAASLAPGREAPLALR